MMTKKVLHPTLGTVNITMRANAVRFIARWKDGEVWLTIPPFATAPALMQALEGMAPALLARRPQSVAMYRKGETMEFDGFSITFAAVGGLGARCSVRQLDRSRFEISVDRDADMTSRRVTEAVSRLVDAVAKRVAPGLLLPLAAGVSERVGVKPDVWKISSGRKLLGRCTSRREIAISRVMVFAPAELRDYVVCHELAHLTEMNHSPRFHALCDSYCGGRERELERKLKSFRFPVL